MPFFAPVDALNKLFDLDRKVALPIVAGLAVVSAAAIVTSWNISYDNFATAALIGLYVVALGLLLTVVAFVIDNRLLQQALGFVVVAAIIATITVFFISAAFRPAWLQPPWCLAKFWIPCPIVERDILAANGKEITAAATIPARIAASPSTAPSSTSEAPIPSASPHRVYIQFAGLITRDSIVQLNGALRRGGWRVEGASGERTPVAAGLNEVRYSRPEDAAAAERLASAVSATGLTSRAVTTKRLGIIGATTLELWISN